METISILVERSRSGDREAFARIVKQYQGMVSAATLNVVGNYAQSEDLAQETFLTAWRKLPELREPEKLASWRYGIARRVALRWTEQQQRNPLRQAAELDAETMSDRQAQMEAEERQHREQSLELIWATVKELPETFREPLLLYYRYSKSVADIAASLSLTDEAVYKRLARGREMLKTEVEKQIETVLESTRPDTAFTLAVLASLPLVAATTGCSLAGTGTVAGSQAGWFGSWTLLLLWYVCAPVILVTGGFAGLYTALKHSPTIRTRRFMCQAAMQWYVFAWVFMLVKLLASNKHGGWEYPFGGTFFFGYFAVIIAYCSWLVYRWRMLLEEDAGLRPSSKKTSPSLFWLRCWFWGSILPTLLFNAALASDIYHQVYKQSSVMAPLFATVTSILWMSVPIGFFLVVGYGIRTSRDENSLHWWYPRHGGAFLPKSEEKTRWKSFWFDLAVMYSVTAIPQIPLVIFSLLPNGVAGWVIISTMMMTFATLIASHSAGIPGKRLRGYTKLFLVIGLCYLILFSLRGH
jgi:RNA polymerase sigma factor (sigma-70 family)